MDIILNKLYQAWDSIEKDDFAYPVIGMVDTLPKSELGAIAEALVEITKFKRHVSRQEETVGGPIDVAILTKGDGFAWIKRKHYFKPELNPRLLAQLSRCQ